MRTIILAVGVGVLIVLYSRYVLLAIVITYILYGLLSRFAGLFRRRADLTGSNVPAKEI
jgi:hypothetical protein